MAALPNDSRGILYQSYLLLFEAPVLSFETIAKSHKTYRAVLGEPIERKVPSPFDDVFRRPIAARLNYAPQIILFPFGVLDDIVEEAEICTL
jgi:hypothetical protein